VRLAAAGSRRIGRAVGAPAGRLGALAAGTQRVRTLGLVGVVVLAAALGTLAARPPGHSPVSPKPPAPASASASSPGAVAFLDTLERKSFDFFWERSDSATGLTPDRWPTPSFVSVGAVGFALTAYPIGAERGYVTRAQAAARTLATLRFFWQAPQDTARSRNTGYRGFFYHFLDPKTGARWETVELSTIDTGLFLAGALFCQSYFDRDAPAEIEIRALAESLYARADWDWVQPRPPAIGHGWSPEEGFIPYAWRGYNEAMVLQILPLGSPTHPAPSSTWQAWTSTYRWGTFNGYEHVGFAALFGHQYSHVWVDFRGIQDSTMRAHGMDYFENSRRAALAQLEYAKANPQHFAATASGWGPVGVRRPAGRHARDRRPTRTFRTYSARGASFTNVEDVGTVAPTALGGSIPFAPDETIAALRAIRETYGPVVFGRYGFIDALNPTLQVPASVHHGHVVPGIGWFDTDYLGIDQGPIVAMIENHRSELVWRTMRRNAHLVRGLRRAGFTGGWLDKAAER
jgi:hypothetical protein